MYFKKILLLVSVVLFSVLSCTTTKNTAVTRTYHNVVSRYNIFFNAREAYRSGLQKIERAYKEEYTTILPVFYYKDKSVLAQVGSDMDRAIQKSTKLIKNHSLTARPAQKQAPTTQRQRDFLAQKEYNKWVKEAYLLMGKAWFYKQDYVEAQKNFEYIISEYRNDPIRVRAQIWLAKTRVERGQLDEAKEILQRVKENPVITEKLEAELYALLADIYIQQKKYEDAITQLTIARDKERKKKLKVRYTFILAQLYKEIGDSPRAIAFFREVEKMNPTYEMTFQARINQATAYDGIGSSNEIIEMLERLLRDANNIEFRDQIYYALANIYYQDNREKKALEYYLLSVENSKSDSYQKAMSYLAIGQIYYSQRKYLDAQPYYDSCMMILPGDYRNKIEVQTRTNNLNALAREHFVVFREDSLQRIAQMPEQQRLAFVDNIIDDIRRREHEARQREQERAQQTAMFVQDFGQDQQGQTGKWYFYNESAVAFGKVEFTNRWGDRKLEDNWRNSNKSRMVWNDSPDVDDAELEEQKEEQVVIHNIHSRAFYLQNLPLTDSAKEVSTKRIEQSLFALGMIYKNSIQDNRYAIETLERFIQRFPLSEYVPIALYNLHIMCLEERMFDKAEQYKNQIISKYPDSNYAKALTDPSFLQEIRNRERETEKLYVDAYRAFVRNNNSEVISIAQTARSQYPNSELIPHFMFLQTIAIGKRDGIEPLKQGLQRYIAEFPKQETTKLAQSMLEYLEKAKEEVPAEELLQKIQAQSQITTPTREEEYVDPFVYRTQVPHIFVISVRTEFIDIHRLRFNMINYNLDYFTNFNFKISIRELDARYSLLVVEPFDNNTQAMNYFNLITYSEEIFDGVERAFCQLFIIDTSNFSVLLSQKNLDRYLLFFSENYIR